MDRSAALKATKAIGGILIAVCIFFGLLAAATWLFGDFGVFVFCAMLFAVMWVIVYLMETK